MKAPTLIRWIAPLAIGLTGPTLAPAQEEAAVMLPPVIVDQAQRPIRWNYISMPGFEMITNAPPSSGREFAENYYRQEQLLRALIPGKYLWNTSVPAMHIMVEGRAAERLTDEALEQFFTAPSGNANNNATTNRRQRERTEFLPNLRLEDPDSSVVFIRREANRTPTRFDTRDLFGFRMDSENRFQFTPGLVAFRLTRRTPSLPPWFIAGMVGVYAQTELEDGKVKVDSNHWETPLEADMLRRNPLRPREVAPLRRLFDSPPANATPEHLAAWRDQCALFVRWALFADEGAHRSSLWRFLDWIEGSPVDATAFEQCFGLDYVEARDAVSDYLPQAVQDYFEIDPGRLPPMPPIVARAASSVEAARIRAEWERLEVAFVRKQHPDLAPAYLRHARNNLQAAKRAIGSSQEIAVAAGLLEFDAGNYPEASRELETAIALGATRPRAAYALAKVRFEMAKAAAGGAPISAADTGGVLSALAIARRNEPRMAEVYTLMGDLWLNSEMRPLDPDLEALEEGVRNFPSDAAVIGRVALVYAHIGEIGQAVSLLNLGLDQAHTQNARDILRRLLAQLGGLRSRSS